MRLRQVQLVLHLVFLSILGLRELGREVIHLLLIGGQQFLGFADPRLDRGGIGVQCGRVRFRIANSLREGKVELVIRNAHCRLSERLFIRSNSALRKPDCHFISGLVHQVGGGNGRDAFFPDLESWRRFPPTDGGDDQQQRQNGPQDFFDERSALHQCQLPTASRAAWLSGRASSPLCETLISYNAPSAMGRKVALPYRASTHGTHER